MKDQIAQAQPKYSRDEIERRWLVDMDLVGDLSKYDFVRVDDLYIKDTRIRVRRMTDQAGNSVYKLTRKYGKRTLLSEPMATLYITGDEYDLLNAHEGTRIRKTRYVIGEGSLDVFTQPSSAPSIFECEFASEELANEFEPPRFVVEEITGKENYSGRVLSELQGDNDFKVAVPA